MNIGYDELYYALEESLKLQKHYAELLNMQDGGERIIFDDVRDWITRLRKIEKQKEKEQKRNKS